MDYYGIEIIEKLRTDNGKTFVVGDDIAFTIINPKTKYHDKYIGEIKAISNKTITIKRVEINRNQIDGEMVINLGDIQPNSCNYVSCD